MTEHTRPVRERLVEITAQLPLALRDALDALLTPLLDRADDVATLLDYRRKIALGDLASPVDETDPYMLGLGDALAVVLRAQADADADPEVAGDVQDSLDGIASALAQLGYAHRDPDPVPDRSNSRGLGQMETLPGAFAGQESGSVRVYESSAASYPNLWLQVKDEKGKEATIQLRAETSWLLARHIVSLVRNHYHGLDIDELTTPEEGDRVVAYKHGGATLIGIVGPVGDAGDLGLFGTPLADTDAAFVIWKGVDDE